MVAGAFISVHTDTVRRSRRKVRLSLSQLQRNVPKRHEFRLSMSSMRNPAERLERIQIQPHIGIFFLLHLLSSLWLSLLSLHLPNYVAFSLWKIDRSPDSPDISQNNISRCGEAWIRYSQNEFKKQRRNWNITFIELKVGRKLANELEYAVNELKEHRRALGGSEFLSLLVSIPLCKLVAVGEPLLFNEYLEPNDSAVIGI